MPWEQLAHRKFTVVNLGFKVALLAVFIYLLLMKSGRTTRRSIRSAIFIGVLAGSVFSGSGAFAEVVVLNQSNFYSTITSSPNGEYELSESIDIGIADEGEAPTGSTVFGTFSGSLDGKGNVISGISRPLFSQLDGVGGTVTIENLELRAIDTVEGVLGSGMLAVAAENSVISNVNIEGNVTSESVNIGGLIGSATNVNLIDVHSSAGVVSNISISPNGATGGLIGELNGILDGFNRITNSSSSMNVTTNSASIGGLIGSFSTSTGTIENSFASGDVSGNNNVGGLLGISYGTVLNSYAESDVTATYSGAGGLIGIQSGGAVMNSSASGRVEGSSSVGGLIGQMDINYFADNAEPVIQNSMIAGQVIGTSQVGGLVGAGYGSITNSKFSGTVEGATSVGGLAGVFYGTIENSYASASIEGSVEKIGGLVGQLISSTSPASIENSYSVGTIESNGEAVGGLVGYTSNSSINNSYSDMEISGYRNVGGLIGQADLGTEVTHSYSTGELVGMTSVGGVAGSSEGGNFENVHSTIQINGTNEYVGGIVGVISNNTSISNAYYSGTITSQTSANGSIGGIVGKADTGSILQNVNSAVTINTSGMYVGGIVGYAYGSLDVENSTSTYEINAHNYVGGLIGYTNSLTPGAIELTNSFGRGSLSSCEGCAFKGSLIGFADGAGVSGSIGVNVTGIINQYLIWNEMQTIPAQTSVLQNFATQHLAGNTWAICASANGSNPYLMSMYLGDPCQVSTSPRPKKSLRELAEVFSPEKIEETIGFKNNAPLPKDGAIAFVESAAKFDISKVKAVQIVPTENVKTFVKVGEALQISLNSESKEPVELWVRSADGKWLLAGVITFYKDGKAILPPLQFKSAGDFTLVFNKQSADSAKGSAPLNQTGSLLVAVS